MRWFASPEYLLRIPITLALLQFAYATNAIHNSKQDSAGEGAIAFGLEDYSSKAIMDAPNRVEVYDIDRNHDELNRANDLRLKALETAGEKNSNSDSIYPESSDPRKHRLKQRATNPRNPSQLNWAKETVEMNAHQYKPARHDLSPKQDPCTITSRAVGPISYNVVKACLDADFDFSETLRHDTAETIKSLISSFYVYEDIAANPPTDDDAQSLSFLQAELVADIDRLVRHSDNMLVIGDDGDDDDQDEEAGYQAQHSKNILSATAPLTHREFHDGLSQILSKARDGHLSYDADCFRAFRFQHGFFMNHVVRDGQTVLKVHSVAPYFEKVNEIHDSIVGCEVVRIGGRDASEYMQEWADKHVPMSKDANIRFNAALVTPQYHPGTIDFFIPGKFSERFILPEEKSLEFAFRCLGHSPKDLLRVDVKWVGFYTHDITRPYRDTQSYYETNCIKSVGESAGSEDGRSRLEMKEDPERKRMEELKSELRDLLINSSTSTSTASAHTESPPRPTSSSSDSSNTVDEILSKLDMISPQQLPVVKLYDDHGGRLGEMEMASTAASFTELYRGQHGITALLLEDGKTGVITVRAETSTIRGQSYSRVHPAWAGSLIQAINVLRPLAENLILDLKRPRLVTSIRLSPLGKHMMAAGAMGTDHFIKSYGEPVVAAYQDGYLLHTISHPHRNLTFTDYLSDRCAIADHYIIKVDPEEESKRNRSSSSSSKGPRTTDDHVYHPWDPENMVILTDGYCGSSCALISNMMHTKFGVRTVVIGGRTPTTEPMSYSTFPGLQVIDDQLIFSEIHDVRMKMMLKKMEDEGQTGPETEQTRFSIKNQDLIHSYRESEKRRNQDILEVGADDNGGDSDSDGNKDEDEDDEEDDQDEDSNFEFLYPVDFAHKSRLRLTWRQIYNTGPNSHMFEYSSESGSYAPMWSEADQWQEYSFIPATQRIEYTNHNVHSIGTIWEDARDAIWGISDDDS
ncbi:hypothetical protein BGX26_010314 [Mortierella sp. AD094]|nr:hypothetical protein BGX26_010314 [Mortierella sp. AD094]